MFEHYYAVIMAGGGGTRLWPLSRKNNPKQLIDFGTGRTFFQMACDRLEGLFPPDHVIVVTIAEQAKELQHQYQSIPEENYLIEPLPRGTASVVGLAAAVLQKRDPEAVMAVLTADHFINDVKKFQNLLISAFHAAKENYLVTLGIKPTFPSTGYGYIQYGEKIGTFNKSDCFLVIQFKEKPDLELANQFIASQDHYWNSGMFIWKAEKILTEFRLQMPEVENTLRKIQNEWGTPGQNDGISAFWPGIKPQTIDYGIMEHASNVVVIPAIDLGWSDVGSWDSLFDVLPTDENGNIFMCANHMGHNNHSTLVYSQNSDRLIVTLGLKDTIVVDTGDAILICAREEAQEVKKIVDQLNKEKRFNNV